MYTLHPFVTRVGAGITIPWPPLPPTLPPWVYTIILYDLPTVAVFVEGMFLSNKLTSSVIGFEVYALYCLFCYCEEV